MAPLTPTILARIEATSTQAMDLKFVEANIRATWKRKLPQVHKLPSWGKFKGETPIALVGGGPSLKDTMEELRAFRHVVACGSSHDYLIENGIEPEFCAVVDPDPIAANYLRKPCPTTTYLVASECHADVFDALENHQVAVWHCAGIDPKHYRGAPAIPGGCTIMLRAIPMFMMMGWGNQHLFGMDSCFRDNESHAYSAESVDHPIDARLTGSDKVFLCAPYHLAQIDQFRTIILKHYGDKITFTSHGDGVITELLKVTGYADKLKEIAA